MQAGLVERRRAPNDRRAWNIYLTNKSRPMLGQLKVLADDLIERALGLLGPLAMPDPGGWSDDAAVDQTMDALLASPLPAAGPPVLGFLGDHVGILRALLAVAVMLLLALFTLPAVAEDDEGRPVTAPQGGTPA